MVSVYAPLGTRPLITNPGARGQTKTPLRHHRPHYVTCVCWVNVPKAHQQCTAFVPPQRPPGECRRSASQSAGLPNLLHLLRAGLSESEALLISTCRATSRMLRSRSAANGRSPVSANPSDSPSIQSRPSELSIASTIDGSSRNPEVARPCTACVCREGLPRIVEMRPPCRPRPARDRSRASLDRGMSENRGMHPTSCFGNISVWEAEEVQLPNAKIGLQRPKSAGIQE